MFRPFSMNHSLISVGACFFEIMILCPHSKFRHVNTPRVQETEGVCFAFLNLKPQKPQRMALDTCDRTDHVKLVVSGTVRGKRELEE
jgi:hypothetical protein